MFSFGINIETISADIARELRTNPERWTQGAIARDADGNEAEVRNPAFSYATCYCLEGHIILRVRRTGASLDAANEAIHDFRVRLEMECDLYKWNDDPGRTVADVIALCDRLSTPPATNEASKQS